MKYCFMKIGFYSVLLPVMLFFSACVKDPKPVTRPVEFTATTYESLGTWDDNGKPNYLVTPRDNISANMISFINSTLQEGEDLKKTHPELLSSTAIADIKITQTSDVFLTFVTQSALQTDLIGFYSYPTTTPPTAATDIKTITYVFPNSGVNTGLIPGDKVKLGRFNPGTSIGFVLLQKAWDKTTKTINNKAVHFCSNDALNPEIDPALKKHAVLINYVPENKVVIGFEDLDRTKPECDHDFNDVVIYATVTPS
jgi:hypothetical protein